MMLNPEPNSFLPALIEIKQVMHISSLSRASIYRGIKAGTFPSPVRVSAGRVAWRTADIDAWCADPFGWGEKIDF